MKPIVIGYYTVDTPYELEARKLIVSLEALGYEHDLLPVENLGSWQKNTQFKAQVVEQMLLKHQRPILYLDVDAVMVQKPVLLDGLSCDIAAVHFADTTELLSGTVYFTPQSMPVVKRWQEINEAYPEKLPDGRLAWDQRTLRLAIKELQAHFVELPQEYTWIVELTQKRFPGLAPVILHTRGALRFQDMINGGEV